MPGRSSGNPADSGDSSHSSGSSNPSALTGNTLYVALFVVIALAMFGGLAVIVICFRRSKSAKQRNRVLLKQSSGITPLVSRDIKALDEGGGVRKMGDILRGEKIEEIGILVGEDGGGGKAKGKGVSGMSDASCSASSSAEAASVVSVEVQNIGWGRWYGLRELEAATRGFSDENVVGEGGYGIVYRGVLDDGSVVAVKNLFNNKGQAEKEFEIEVEAIGRVRHKNLVGLIGYCAEGAKRMLVYEFVDNGNLEQWLHGDIDGFSPLTWDLRMKIAIGTAKGLAYLHEGLEPKVVHRDVKSSNILLDRSWNAKVSDFGLAKLLGSEASYVTTRVMGTFGYVSPEYASTGMLSEVSDVYSYGVLLMELITGRSPVDYSRPPGEINLVDWFKGMVASRHGEDVLDPRIEVKPSSRALKRAMLVSLRCIDMDAYKRPKMGQIVHMLEADEFPFRSEHRPAREMPPLPHNTQATSKVQCPSAEVAVGDVQRSARWRR